MDKKQKLLTSIAQIIFLAIFFASAFLIGILLGHYNEIYTEKGIISDGSIIFYAAGMLMFAASVYLQIIIHECGHLIFGLVTGYKFCSIRFSSFMWIKLEGKIRFKRYSLAGTGGQCLMAPPELIDGRMPFVLYNLGGCIANIIFSGMLLTCGLIYDVPYLSLFFIVCAIWGFSTALQNGIPFDLATVSNDGSNTLSLCKSRSARQGFWLSMKVGEALTNNIRIKDMPEEWFDIKPDGKDIHPLALSAEISRCDRLLDAHRFEEAKKDLLALLDSASNKINGVTRAILVCNLICCETFGENRSEVYERFLTKEHNNMVKALAKNIGVIRTGYVRALLIDNDPQKAGEVLREFDKMKNTYPYPSDYELESELIAIADALAKERAKNQ